jgi:hypothetical protein
MKDYNHERIAKYRNNSSKKGKQALCMQGRLQQQITCFQKVLS